jgi:hypothetical protein
VKAVPDLHRGAQREGDDDHDGHRRPCHDAEASQDRVGDADRDESEQGCIRSPTVTGERHEDDSGWRDEPQQLIAELRTFRCCLLPLYRDGPDRPFRLGRRGQACCRQGLRLTD